MPLPNHRAHDYRHLISRWRKVARDTGLKLTAFAREAGYPVYSLRSKKLGPTGGIYISAGIHGDEPAGTEGLITWAEANLEKLSGMPCLIFPCLNPWGLVNNSRVDAWGRDLNRVFHHEGPGPIPADPTSREAAKNSPGNAVHALKQMVKPHQFSLALTLHEDYDGQGVYIYEIERLRPYWGEALLEVARPFLPIEGRTSIDGRRARSGLVRRKLVPARFRKMGFPEAVFLHLNHAQRTFTIETPSEFALDQRIAAQVAIIEECLRRQSAMI